jgi:N-glycosylase/DNA lyase
MWKRLLKAGVEITTNQLNLKNTLMNGQCFNWKEVEIGIYAGIVNKNVILMKEAKMAGIDYLFLHREPEDLDEEAFLNNYLQMDVDLEQIIKDLKLPPALNEVATRITGVRILKQDVFECTLSFICSSNNNIDRIRKMLESFRMLYGKILLSHDKYGNFYSFPELDALKNVEEQVLRDKGFGYRAKYIVKSLEYIRENNGLEWISSLESLDDPTEELQKLQGVGKKVADCIALFSLQKHHVVPLDIHMINFYNESIAGLDGSFKKLEKTDKKSFQIVAKNFIKIFGNYAGWIHSVFFMNRIDKTIKKEKKEAPKSKSKKDKNKNKSINTSKHKSKLSKIEIDSETESDKTPKNRSRTNKIEIESENERQVKKSKKPSKKQNK